MPLFTRRRAEKEVKVTFADGLLFVEREQEGKQVFPLEFFPALQNATDEERADWTQTDKGIRFNCLGLDVNC